LIIGGGDGGAAEEALKHPSIEQVVMVELDGKVVEIAKEHFATIHRGVFDNPKLKLLIEDGLKYLAETREKFDHIALDLPDPIGPATALYEEAFFRDCKRALAREAYSPYIWDRPGPGRAGEVALCATRQAVQDRAALHDVHPTVRLPVVDVCMLGFNRCCRGKLRRDRHSNR